MVELFGLWKYFNRHSLNLVNDLLTKESSRVQANKQFIDDELKNKKEQLINLPTLDDLFTTEQERIEQKLEKIVEINISERKKKL